MSSYGFKSARHARAGFAIIAVSLAALFAWGARLFDTPIDWGQRPLTTGAFFAWLILGVYGAGYGGGHKLAFRYAAYATGALALIVAIRELPQFIG